MDLHVDVRGRLWLLDVPENLGCPARVIVHNLKRNNQLIKKPVILTDLSILLSTLITYISQICISFKKWRNATIVWHGTKMGTSSGLFCDVEDGLHYFMSLERASVRWDTKLPLKAESHSVLVQNQNCPCISDYAMDGQKILWGLINSRCPNTIVDSSTKVTVKSRTTRIGKYSASRR
ncbi:hypothetical protein WN48_10900 [Eufriesea mexicana]|uniref:Bee-milk protein n=1 Tax=Eufriesea mexicana TaxID=516756 RepID=A0A310SR91_9HYME|nr:hypothetical protein WN48_10900 [Eufriesea mexicana]